MLLLPSDTVFNCFRTSAIEYVSTLLTLQMTNLLRLK